MTLEQSLLEATDYLDLERKQFYDMTYDEKRLEDVRRLSPDVERLMEATDYLRIEYKSAYERTPEEQHLHDVRRVCADAQAGDVYQNAYSGTAWQEDRLVA